jgi:hypothetical protein
MVQKNNKNDIVISQGQKYNSGYDNVRDSDYKTKHKQEYWVEIGGIKLIRPDENLRNSNRNDLIIFAYNKNNNEVLAYWNATKKQGSSVSLTGLIFHPYIIVALGLSAFIYYYVNIGAERVENPFNYNSGIIVLLMIAFYFSYANWSMINYAQKKVNAQKNNLKK